MIKVGVIGTGYWGKNHLRVINSIAQAELSMIVDSREDIAKKYAKSYRTEYSTNYTDLLERDDIQAVILATPNSSHYSIAKDLIENGKNVLVEKPLCLTVENARKIIDLAKENSVTLMVGHIFSFNPAIRVLKQNIENHILGEIMFITISRMGLFPPRNDSGIILDLAIHDFDVITYLFNRKLPESITAVGGSYIRRAFEETAFVSMEYTNGIIANTNVSWLTPVKVRNLLISGTKGTASLNLITQELEIFESRIEENHNDLMSSQVYDLIYKEGMSYKPIIKKVEPLTMEDEHFINCLINKETPLVNGEVALKTLIMAEGALKSMKERKTIRIQHLYP
ncbi:MAG: gfo/Idh/MocA family oxidoreductase [Candidatus Lokiarchaeota archaeon]|nr:gfo/Idh/MocA family oxidoreductase [Candidatus Lokiarchaeota archaeon]